MGKCPTYLFEEYEEPFASSICAFFDTFSNFVDIVMVSDPYISLICILINVLHFVILVQKPLRSSSINLIMAAIAVADILSLLNPIQKKISSAYIEFQNCPIVSYQLQVLSTFLDGLQYISRRFSVWLSLAIAIIRTLVIRNPLSPKYGSLSKPISAFYCCLVTLPICLPISILGWLKYQIKKTPYETDCLDNTTTVEYMTVYSNLFTKNDNFVFRMYNLIDPSISSFIPCIMFPIFTFFLGKELLKNEENRAKMMNNSGKADNSSKRKTKLVLYLTITFFIAEFPVGLVRFVKLFHDASSGIVLLLTYFYYLFSLFLSAYTATHMIICLFMSSQYLQTAKSLLGLTLKANNKKMSVISVTPSTV